MTLARNISFIGRAEEQRQILNALDRGGPRALVVTGPAGAGKSALLAQIRLEAATAGALTGAGKHGGDGGQTNEPFIAALEDAVTAGLQSLYDPDGALTALRDLLGAGGDVLAAFGRGPFRRLAHRGPSAAPLTADAAEARFSDLALRVLRWLEGFQQPVILVLDDWGRAPAPTQRLYRRIATDASLTQLRVLASERNTEPFEGIAAFRLSLGNLSRAELVSFVAAKLAAHERDVGELANALNEHGATMPLVAADYLLRLDNAGAFTGGIDLARARALLRTFEGHAPLQRDHLARPALRHVAATLALMETDVESQELESAHFSTDELASAVTDLETAGVARRIHERISLAHDTFREAILAELGKPERQERSAALAEHLRRCGHDPATPGKGALMLRLRLAGGIEQIEPRLWESGFHQGGAAARRRGDRASAHAFSRAALSLAARRGHHDIDILLEAALAAIEQGRHADALTAIRDMQQNAGNEVERAQADETLVYAMRMTGDLDGALAAARAGLERMGIRAPSSARSFNTIAAISRALLASPQAALHKPPLSAAELATEAPMMRAVHALATLLFERSPAFAAGFLARSVSPRVAAGTAAGAAAYAVICSNLGFYRQGALWSQVSDARQSGDQPLRAASMLYATNTGPRILRDRAMLAERRSAMINVAIEQGEISVALYTMRDRIQDALLSAAPLAEIRALADDALELSAHLQDPGIRVVLGALRQTIETLMVTGAAERSAPRDAIAGEAPIGSLSLATNTQRTTAILAAMRAAAFGDYETLAALYEHHCALFGGVLRNEQSRTWIFFTSLGLLRARGQPPRRYRNAMAAFARINPDNHLHRHLLLLAERHMRQGRWREALSFYERAIGAAAQSWLERGVIGRAASESALLMGDRETAARFEGLARQAWSQLGATALVLSLTDRTQTSQDNVDEEKVSQGARARILDAEAARADAERANLARSRLLAAIGHELKTPLQGLKGIVELGDLDAPLNRAALTSAVDQLTLAIDELTDLAVSESDVIHPKPEPVSLAQVLDEVAALARPALAGERLIVVRCAPDLPAFLLDARRLRQILNNLAANAVKYGAGAIVLAAEAAPTEENDWRVHIYVDDEGRALSETEWARLFEPFQRGVDTQDEGGLGLGLAISRRIAAALGGELSAARTETGATRFHLSMDVALATPDVAKTPHPPSGLRILLAEDETLSRNVIAALLAREGAIVHTAADGDAAVDDLAGRRFDIVLVDARMPGRPGIEVARHARARDGRTTIALMSAAMDDALLNEANALGAYCLKKPLGQAELATLLSMHAEQQNECTPFERSPASSAAPLPVGADEVRKEAQKLLDGVLAAHAAGDVGQTHFLAHKLAGLSAQFRLSALQSAAQAVQAHPGQVHAGDIERLRIAGAPLLAATQI